MTVNILTQNSSVYVTLSRRLIILSDGLEPAAVTALEDVYVNESWLSDSGSLQG